MKSSSSEKKQYFCTLPWTGLFSVKTNLDVVFCPCFLKMKIGNLENATLHEVWNSEKLQELRRSFSRGELPEPCENQLCPTAVDDKV